MPDHSRRAGAKRAGIVVRRARFDDIDALARLEAQSFSSDKLSRRSLLRLARSPSATFLLASSGDRLLGYAVVLFRRGVQTARLYSIAVAAAEAGRGVGSRLLAAAEDAARRRRATQLRLEVRADNPTAIGFYRARGYRQTGSREGYYEDGMLALRFARGFRPTAAVPSPARRLRRAA